MTKENSDDMAVIPEWQTKQNDAVNNNEVKNSNK